MKEYDIPLTEAEDRKVTNRLAFFAGAAGITMILAGLVGLYLAILCFTGNATRIPNSEDGLGKSLLLYPRVYGILPLLLTALALPAGIWSLYRLWGPDADQYR